MKELNDTNLIQLLVHQYGTKVAVMYYLRKVKDASARAKLAITSENQGALTAETQAMIDNVEIVYKILTNDENRLSGNSEQE